MNPRWPLLAAALCIFGPMSLPAKAAPAGGEKARFQAIYSAVDAAASRKDVDGSLKYVAPDWQGTSVNGEKMTVAQSRAKMDQLNAMAQSIRVRSTVKSVRISGRTAQVTVDETVVATIPDPHTRQTTSETMRAVSRDTWRKNGTGWILIATKELSETGR